LSERDEVLLQLAERARFYAGLTTIGLPPRAAIQGPAQLAGPVQSLPDRETPAGPNALTLDAVRQELGDCQRCKLARTRKTIVFGQGNPQAALMFVGEAPGADEDEQGLAFVGKAGQLLTKIIEAMGMTREDVFIANILKCRPPQNRNPEPDEVLACHPFLEKQIAAIQPKVIVGLGKFGAQWLLKTMEPITRLRGRLGQFQGIMVMPTYHPAYLLRNPGSKKEVWEDMKVVRDILARG
jgi:uracil-DNA glycosylase